MSVSYRPLNPFFLPSLRGSRGEDCQSRHHFFLLALHARLDFCFPIHHSRSSPGHIHCQCCPPTLVCCITTLFLYLLSFIFPVLPHLLPPRNHNLTIPVPTPACRHPNLHTPVFLLLQYSTDSAATSPTPAPFICICPHPSPRFLLLLFPSAWDLDDPGSGSSVYYTLQPVLLQATALSPPYNSALSPFTFPPSHLHSSIFRFISNMHTPTSHPDWSLATSR